MIRLTDVTEENRTKGLSLSVRDDHIMEVYLSKERAGVIAMHVLDFNEELHNQSLREEGIAIGRAKERLEALAQMLQNGGTDDDLRKFHNATDEEIMQAKKIAENN